MANARDAAEQTTAPINEKAGGIPQSPAPAEFSGITPEQLAEAVDSVTERINNLESYLSGRISALENS